MKKGIRGHDIEAQGLENICASAEEHNIKYLQLILEKSIAGFKMGDFTEEYASSLKNQLNETKIAVLGSYINPSNPDDEELNSDIEKFKEKIKYASMLNPIVVGTETGIYKKGMTNSEEAYQRVLSTIRDLLIEAEKFGVNIGIEGVHCFVINTPQKMKRLIDDLNSDNVKVIFDPVNYLNIDNYKDQDKMINDMFSLLSDKICVLHAKDFIVENGELKPALPAEGILNYRLIFEKMKEYNLDIPIICEEINEDEASIAFDNLEKIWRKLQWKSEMHQTQEM